MWVWAVRAEESGGDVPDKVKFVGGETGSSGEGFKLPSASRWRRQQSA